MSFSKLQPLALAIVGPFAAAAPTLVGVNDLTSNSDSLIKRGIELGLNNPLEKRLTTDISLDYSWDFNETLYSGTFTQSADGLAETVDISVSCVECYTLGQAIVNITDDDVVDPKLSIMFEGFEAYIDLGVNISAGATYTLTLYGSNTPVGLSITEFSIGIVFYLDLVLAVTAELDLTAGFYVTLDDGSYLEADFFSGDIMSYNFDGVAAKGLPVTVTNGDATFKADLRLRLQAGVEATVDGLGIGIGADVGIYANLLEFVAEIETTESCALETIEYFDINVGAYAELDVVVDYSTIGLVPTESTTIYTIAAWTQCWMSASHATATTAATLAKYAYVEAPITTNAIYPVMTSTSKYPITTLSPQYPIANSSDAVNSSGLVTSTVYKTKVHTITKCAANVVNCPARYASEIYLTETIDVYTTVCPATAAVTPSWTLPSTTSRPTHNAKTVMDVRVFTPVATPVVNTFVGPTTTSSTEAFVSYGAQEVEAANKKAASAHTHSAVPYPARNGTVASLSMYNGSSAGHYTTEAICA